MLVTKTATSSATARGRASRRRAGRDAGGTASSSAASPSRSPPRRPSVRTRRGKFNDARRRLLRGDHGGAPMMMKPGRADGRRREAQEARRWSASSTMWRAGRSAVYRKAAARGPRRAHRPQSVPRCPTARRARRRGWLGASTSSPPIDSKIAWDVVNKIVHRDCWWWCAGGGPRRQLRCRLVVGTSSTATDDASSAAAVLLLVLLHVRCKQPPRASDR